MKDIQLVKTGRVIGVINVSLDEWETLHTIDYIEIDEVNRVLDDFKVHGNCTYVLIQKYVHRFFDNLN